MKSDIKYLVMDVDGTLTNGKIYMGREGELIKVFDVKDGCGIKDILPEHSIIPIIITARNSDMLKRRCDELGIQHLYQGIRDKFDKLNEILREQSKITQEQCSLKNVAYIGDDILDLQCMLPVKNAGGLVACPRDAVKKVRDISDYICEKEGGCGAVREFIEWLAEDKE